MSVFGAQIPLGLRLPREQDLETFVPGPNGEALAAVRACAGGEGEPYVYLWGERGCGRTHLLLGACRAAREGGCRAFYLDLGNAAELDTGLLQALEQLDLVALDNCLAVAGDRTWERALFDLFNRLRECGARLLIAGDLPPAQLPLRLPDLRSRLTWGPVYQLRPLDDAGRTELLQRSARARGMHLPEEAVRYILTHCPRDPHSLEALLDRLDHASLVAKKVPSVHLIRSLLNEKG